MHEHALINRINSVTLDDFAMVIKIIGILRSISFWALGVA